MGGRINDFFLGFWVFGDSAAYNCATMPDVVVVEGDSGIWGGVKEREKISSLGFLGTGLWFSNSATTVL